jgi:exonuclease III
MRLRINNHLFFFILLLLIVWRICGCKKTADNTLVVATLNAAFLWDGSEPEEGMPWVTFPHRGDSLMAAEHMKNVAAVIRKINADILNLVEVENIEALRLFNETYLTGMGYTSYLVNGTDSYTGQDVALLSRIPVLSFSRFDSVGVSDTITSSVSKNYYATLTIDNMPVAIIGIHLISNLSEGNELKREAQADAIRKLVTMLRNGGYEIILLGDMNDYDGDESCRDINGHLPNSEVLKILTAADTLDFTDDLINIIRYIPINQRYTYFWDENDDEEIEQTELAAIDHILVSSRLAEEITKATIYQNYNPLVINDHYPVIVEFTFRH